MTDYSSAHDPYCYPGTNVLRNKQDIRDQATLDQEEARFHLAGRITLAIEAPPAQFNTAYLQYIHKVLFEPLYDWAGEFRTVSIGRGDQMPFCQPQFIRSELDKHFAALYREQNLKGLSLSAFSEQAAHYLGEINAIHPFREGNGRTQRQFISTLARVNGYSISWSNIARDEMTRASMISFYQGENKPLAQLLSKALSPAPERLLDGTDMREHIAARLHAGDDPRGLYDALLRWRSDSPERVQQIFTEELMRFSAAGGLPSSTAADILRDISPAHGIDVTRDPSERER